MTNEEAKRENARADALADRISAIAEVVSAIPTELGSIRDAVAEELYAVVAELQNNRCEETEGPALHMTEDES